MRASLFLIGVVVFGLAIGLPFGWGFSQFHASFAQSNQQPVQTGNAQPRAECCQSPPQESFWERLVTDPTAFGAILLCFITAGLAGYTALLWGSTKALVSSAEETNRKQLIHGEEINRAYLTGGGDVDNGQRQIFRVEVANYGKTPATLHAFDVHYARLHDLRRETQVRPVSASQPFHDHISPGATPKIIDRVPVTDPIADIIFGAFYYEDIWRERMHRVRFILSLSQDAATGVWRTRPDVDVSRLPRGYQDWD